jgi:signal transduction histidine kinase/ligand-binding sensor domain-containing protein
VLGYSRNIILALILLSHFGNKLLFAQYTNLKFEHITIEDGLSKSTVNCILKDSQGFMWFGTDNGLNKYDGYEFTVYKHNQNDTSSISGNRITCISEDFDGNLWIGTFLSGLNKFNRETGVFTKYVFKEGDSNSISSNIIGSLFLDNEENLWIGTFGGGLNKLQRNNNTFTHYKNDINIDNSIGSNYISSIGQDSKGQIWMANNDGYLILFDQKEKVFKNRVYDENFHGAINLHIFGNLTIDSKDNIWIGTDNGLYIYNITKDTFEHLTNIPGINTLNSNAVTSILEDKNGIFWITTDHGGVNLYDSRKKTFNYLLNVQSDNKSLSNNQVYCLFKDDEENYWLGNYNGGINVYYKHKSMFEVYSTEQQNTNSLSDPSVISLCEDKQGKIWIGTDGGGLDVLNPQNKKFKHLKHNPKNKNSICSNIITSVLADKQDNIWIGTYGEGLSFYDQKSKTYTHYKNNPDDESSIINNDIWKIVEDSDSNIWIGTTRSLEYFDRKGQGFIHFINTPNGISRNDDFGVLELIIDTKQNIWMGTSREVLIQRKELLINNNYSIIDTIDIIKSRAITIYEDEKGYIWLGSIDGLMKFDFENSKFTKYTVDNGLSDNEIKSILEDNKGHLWIGTGNGISDFNPANNTFKNYNTSNGLPTNEFNRHTCLLSKSGKMYFGTPKGLISFYPDSLKHNNRIPKIVFTDFQIFNKPVVIGEKSSPLKKNINESDSIVLSYKQSVFTLKYAALNYLSPENNQYAYMLEGFDKDWRYVGTDRKATYTNLDPGTYKFRVKGSNNDGVWNEEGKSIILIITPPFWLTWWFKSLAIVFLIVLLLLIYYIRVRRIRKINLILRQKVIERTKEINNNNIILQQQTEQLNEINTELEERQLSIEELVEELTVQRDELAEVNGVKDKLFSIVAHDLKNPFNTLLGFSDLLVMKYDKYTDEKRKQMAVFIKNSCRDIYELLENLLTWSRSQQGVIQFNPSVININDLIRINVKLTANQAEQKKIVIRAVNVESVINVNIDADLINTVIRNLVSNALKFTPQGGEIVITSKLEDKKVIVSVKDFGVGISEENRKKLFKKNIHFTTSGTANEKGTGLGLIMCQDFIEMHQGRIWVESDEGKGSTFYFTLPSMLN